MTTNTNYLNLIKQLPQHLFEQYFNKPFDYTNYKCIHTNEYDYYPELNCCIIDDVPVIWETNANDLQAINLKNKKHLKEIKRRVQKRFVPTLAVISIGNERMNCQLYKNDKLTQKFVQKKELSYIPFENRAIYYNPNEIDLKNNTEMTLLAKCLFLAHQYKTICIIPYKDTEPEEWESTILIEGEYHG